MYYSKCKKTFLCVAEKLINGILSHVEKKLPDGPQFTDRENYKVNCFLPGTESFASEPSENGKWHLGCSSVSLVPSDWKTHSYYLGGYYMPQNKFCNRLESVTDDMKARVIAMDDGSGRGITVFATVDCIGIANGDVQLIRKAFLSKYQALNPDASFASVNVCGTHTHSCIDTEGLWTGGLDRIKLNFKAAKKGLKPDRGIDESFLRLLIDRVSDAMVEACASMTAGNLTYAVKDLGENYFSNKNRPSASALVTDMTRLVFTPDDKSKTPTMIATIAAHPDIAGLPTGDGQSDGRALSGDYIYYCGELITKAGYNFMFFNGAICAIYTSRGLTNDDQPFKHRYEQSMRFGRELGRMLLAMTMTKSDIEKDELLADRENVEKDMKAAIDNGGKYTLWYEDWIPVEEKSVLPYFNIRLGRVPVKVDNPIIILAGKLNLADFSVVRNLEGRYGIYTEIGYFEIGDSVKAVMVPGEFCADLLKGGKSLTSEGSYSGKAFGLPTLWDIYGENTLAVGLANDEIGYIVPDNDYILSDFKNHYHEELSLGRNTASSVIKGFIDMRL